MVVLLLRLPLILLQAVQLLQSRNRSQPQPVSSDPLAVKAALDIFQTLMKDLDTEGRYLFLNAIANQLRYPNTHTHYFSVILLYLFSDANQVLFSPTIKCCAYIGLICVTKLCLIYFIMC